MQTILVTGSAGFIGYHVARRLVELGNRVIGVDSINDYYGTQIKKDRLGQLAGFPNWRFLQLDIADRIAVEKLFDEYRFDRVIHLAAQAGVRYSLVNPYAYTSSNIDGTLTILEGCRRTHVQHLVYASSSSVYGANTRQPFTSSEMADHPISLYAATKKANELMAHSYSHLYKLPTTGLRFFTVYGPWGRPDMALFKFTKSILEGATIDIYDEGKMLRDFTYIDDVVDAVVRITDVIPDPDLSWDADQPAPDSSSAPYRVYNVGNNRPNRLSRFIEVLEQSLGRDAIKNYLPIQPGDVPETSADIRPIQKVIPFEPSTTIEVGIPKFVKWYRDYFQV